MCCLLKKLPAIQGKRTRFAKQAERETVSKDRAELFRFALAAVFGTGTLETGLESLEYRVNQ
jgi:hypothetical protein